MMDAILNALRNSESPAVLEKMVLFFFYDQVLVMDRPADKAMEIAKKETEIFMQSLELLDAEPLPVPTEHHCGLDPCPTAGCSE